MSNSRKKAALSVDVAKLLNGPIRVKVGDRFVTMSPVEAEFERCAIQAMNGSVKAMCRFVRLCLRMGLIEQAEPEGEFPQVLRIPKDWDHDEFMEQYERHGFPPWPGPRDGLTADARAQLQAKKGRTKR